jgi:pyruvate-ferredoxin/flavodoxin oxidoreductase
MASAAQTVKETVDFLNAQGSKVGVLMIRLYRPFSIKRFMEALPASCQSLVVLDRTKEPGASGEPMYLDVVNSISEGMDLGYGTLAAKPADPGRAIWAFVQRVYTSHGKGRF